MEYQRSLFIRLAEPLLEGFAWGKGAMESEDENPLENLSQYAEAYLTADLVKDLNDLNDPKVGADFIKKVDAFVDQHKYLESIREFLVDLAILQVLDSGKEDPDFLEGTVWNQVEEETEDRGSELINLMIYIRDCVWSEMKPSLEDFLHEFLLVEEDDYQDEFAIYEPMIKAQEMIDGDFHLLIEKGNEQKDDMEELFTPSMIFFIKPERKAGKFTTGILKGSNLAEIHTGIYRLISMAGAVFQKVEE